MIKISSVLSLAEAVFTGSYVSEEIAQERLAICEECYYKKLNKDNNVYCGLCGCRVLYPTWKAINLAAYEENLPKWGCKHPHRGFHGGWKR